MRRKTWKATRVDQSIARTRWQLYHPSYGTYWVLTEAGHFFPVAVETGSKKLPAAKSVVEQFKAAWVDAIGRAA